MSWQAEVEWRERGGRDVGPASLSQYYVSESLFPAPPPLFHLIFLPLCFLLKHCIYSTSASILFFTYKLPLSRLTDSHRHWDTNSTVADELCSEKRSDMRHTTHPKHWKKVYHADTELGPERQRHTDRNWAELSWAGLGYSGLSQSSVQRWAQVRRQGNVCVSERGSVCISGSVPYCMLSSLEDFWESFPHYAKCLPRQRRCMSVHACLK